MEEYCSLCGMARSQDEPHLCTAEVVVLLSRAAVS
jgi:hypothetical protein